MHGVFTFQVMFMVSCQNIFSLVQERSWICGLHALVMCWCKWDWQCPC